MYGFVSQNDSSPSWAATAVAQISSPAASAGTSRRPTCRRGAGAFLVALAAVCLALYLLVAYNVLPYGWPESEWPLALRILKTRFYDGLLTTNSMSAYGFVLFAGLKCLLPEKR